MSSTEKKTAGYSSSATRTEQRRPPGPKNFKEWYLLSYNQVSFFGWFWILFMTCYTLYLEEGDCKRVFAVVGPGLSYVQTAALFEVLHSLFGFIKTPLLTTSLQVASRLFLVWGVNYFVPEIHKHWSFTTMVLAWSIAECVRYIYYIFQLSGNVLPNFIKNARYSFFLVLYPLGVFSELTMVYLALPYAKAISPLYYYALITATLLYIPGFPMLFSHMLVQRRNYLKSVAAKKAKKAH
ncbi:tyrosine phosphatase-like protein [Mycotypha africana]|uniref:tyrosine phosphatase-like protein n=1 Tax=Mycotypha africana TaxID=64632 RepID=UPI002300D9C1|nr:tyrosine phosphatase-like protein [Mycotypha africana]KAI8984300.1 tyrosine phosphatase-like protein [Mycotypha africana]